MKYIHELTDWKEVCAISDVEDASPVTGWQLCPKCNGNGSMSSWMSTNVWETCDVCDGKKIISVLTGQPPC